MRYILSLTFLLVASLLSAQDHGFRSEGREFYLGYIHPTFISNPVYVAPMQTSLHAIISSYEDNQIEVRLFIDGTSKEETAVIYTIKGGTSRLVTLPRTSMRADSIGDKASFVACHIIAKRPISVHYFSSGPNACGSYLALPVSAWGKKYVIASYNDNPGYGARTPTPDLGAGVFLITAAFDGTSVKITPSARTTGGHPGVNQGTGATGIPQPYSISLGRGESYIVRSASAANYNDDDISGTTVEATRPISVIAAHEDALPGDGILADSVKLDSRDFMIEQMIPVEFWHNTGLISIPYIDAPGIGIEGVGENFRLFASDKNNPPFVSVFSGNQPEISTPIVYMPAELRNRKSPLSFSADDTTKFSVMQYDLRRASPNLPINGPTMCTIIPMSQWRNGYAWQIPQSLREYASDQLYVTVIADAAKFNDIEVTVGTKPKVPIGSALKPTAKVWSKGSIPGYPELKAVTYSMSKMTPYFAHADFPFMVYCFGSRHTEGSGVMYNYPFPNGGQFLFSYAHPAGASVFDASVSNWLSVKIDTLCTGGWKICATDSNSNGGIRYVSLIDDAQGNLFAGKNYQPINVSILAPDDPMRLGEINLPGDEKTCCFTIGVNDPGKDAYAPVIIYDKAGNYRILELRQDAQHLTVTPDPFTNPDLFSDVKIGVKSCTTFTVHNEISNTTVYKIDTLRTSTNEFKLSAIKPALPASIPPGDSLTFDVCFEAKDTLLHRDTIRLTAACLDLRLPLAASTVRPILLASDITFGKVLVGKTVCKPLTLKNIGQAAFTVQGGSVVQSGNIFSLDSASQAKFPFMLTPGQSATLTACYTPDTVTTNDAWIAWQTDIMPPFATEQKAITNLSGEGFKEPVSVGKAQQAEMKIYPNPAADNVVLELTNVASPEVSVSISDVLGNELIARTFGCEPSGVQSFTISCAQLANGHYIVRTVAGEEVHSRNLTIKR